MYIIKQYVKEQIYLKKIFVPYGTNIRAI